MVFARRTAPDPGQRRVISGPHAIYHTEIESWQKIEPVFDQQRPPGRSGPDSFIVKTKDGKLLEYGSSIDAQSLASPANPSIREWALNKVTDLNGNYLTITYQQDPAGDGIYPKEIQYTGNANTDLVSQRSIQFTFQTRTDVSTQYVGGYPLTTTQLLQSVQTYLDEQLVTSYSLAYETGVSTGRNRLVSIIQADAQGIALPATTFAWQDGNSGIFEKPKTLSNSNAGTQGQLLPMDVNGDGRTDLVNAYGVDGYLGLTPISARGTPGPLRSILSAGSRTPASLPLITSSATIKPEISPPRINKWAGLVHPDGCGHRVCRGVLLRSARRCIRKTIRSPGDASGGTKLRLRIGGP